MAHVMERLQKLGRALMLPIAVLPVAGLLLRLGQHDMLDIPVLAAAGDALFANLGLVFAVGVAVGFARENHGAAGLASLVGYLVATKGAQSLLVVPAQVLAGLHGDALAAAADAWRGQQVARLSMPVGRTLDPSVPEPTRMSCVRAAIESTNSSATRPTATTTEIAIHRSPADPYPALTAASAAAAISASGSTTM